MLDDWARSPEAGFDTLVSVDQALAVLKSQGWTVEKLLLAIYRRENAIMATLQEVIDAVDQDKAAVEAAAARVSADLAALTQQVTDLQAQIAAGGTVTSADLDALVTSLTAITGEAAAIDAPPAP